MNKTEKTEPAVQKLALSRKETAFALGVHPLTVDRLVKRGLLNPNKSTRRCLFPVAEIQRFLQGDSSKSEK